MAIKRAVTQLEGLKLYYATKPRKRKQKSQFGRSESDLPWGSCYAKQVDWCVIPNQDRSRGVVMV